MALRTTRVVREVKTEEADAQQDEEKEKGPRKKGVDCEALVHAEVIWTDAYFGSVVGGEIELQRQIAAALQGILPVRPALFPLPRPSCFRRSLKSVRLLRVPCRSPPHADAPSPPSSAPPLPPSPSPSPAPFPLRPARHPVLDDLHPPTSIISDPARPSTCPGQTTLSSRECRPGSGAAERAAGDKERPFWESGREREEDELGPR